MMMKAQDSSKSILLVPTTVSNFLEIEVLSQSHLEWKATAIGKNMDSAKTYLEKNYKADMVLEEAIQSALKALKEGFQGNFGLLERAEIISLGQMSAANIEVGIIGEDRKFRVLRESEVKDYIEDFDKS